MPSLPAARGLVCCSIIACLHRIVAGAISEIRRCRGPRPRDGLRRRLVHDEAPRRHNRHELRAAFLLDDRHVAESATPG